ncbi:MAG TPA: HAMP domain-containing sensor histidine kinase [Steroidobacteraceae bacterium]|nr:HAMP domain-containing sensor histidine kinase [Steroidobacteraceae bacterium]
MRPIRIIKSDAFRLAALFAFLFLGFTGILVGTVLWIVEGTQKAALTGANDADIATVTNGFLDEGVPEAIEVVKQRLGSSSMGRAVHPDCYMVIQNEQQQKLAGNLPALAPRLGIFGISLPDSDGRAKPPGTGPRAGPIVILGRGIEVTKGIYLFVGRDTTLLAATRDRILSAFLWVVLGAVVIAVVGGLFLGSRFMRRVDAIARTCKSIIAGRLDERIPVMGRGDEWDRLAGAINEMLNRISALLENLRQVSSDVAHDLRTPLTRMRNRLEAARTKSTNIAEYSAAVATAIDDTDQLLAMFAALLRISQVEAGARLSTFSLVSLTDILENIYQIYLPVAEDYEHSLISDCQKNIAIRGDAELLTQMFSNLVENAIRHTPEHTRIRIVLKSDGRSVAASIIDDGPGIDPAEHQKVLRRFYRISSSRSTAGHGLGLALVAAIAELHHAKLALSNANPGLQVQTTFPTDWDD